MNFNILFFTLGFILNTFYTNFSERNPKDIISEFNKIEATPEIVSFTNDFEINNDGGHLQGIQRFENETGNYFFLSGSSDSYSYCSIIKLDDENKVISVNKLMDKPFKHAGGFQIFKNYLAVGIEDNSIKDKSKVCIYDIAEPLNHSKQPIAIIERNGEPLRSTAGCVGIVNYKNKVLIAVGDWDTKHIDFYSTEFNNITSNAFKKICTVNTEIMSKTGWIDNQWHSYQNINLFNINNELFLIGLGQNTHSEDIADLFKLTENSSGSFSFKKLASKTFFCTNGCSFKASAGAEYTNGEFKIFTSGYNIMNVSYVNIFGSK